MVWAPGLSGSSLRRPTPLHTAGLLWGEAERAGACQLTRAPHLPSCPRTDSGPAFIFSFFSGLLPLGPSRPFLFESLLLPFVRLPGGSGLERELKVRGSPAVLHQLCLSSWAPRSHQGVRHRDSWRAELPMALGRALG